MKMKPEKHKCEECFSYATDIYGKDMCLYEKNKPYYIMEDYICPKTKERPESKEDIGWNCKLCGNPILVGDYHTIRKYHKSCRKDYTLVERKDLEKLLTPYVGNDYAEEFREKYLGGENI